MTVDLLIRALADPTRQRIVRLAAAMELAVGELAQVLGQSQPRVSRHVAILCDAGLLEKRREGSWVFLRRTAAGGEGQAMLRAVDRLLAAAEAEDEGFAQTCAKDRRHLSDIRASRERAAAEYFAAHASEWDRLRALLSPAEAIEAALLDALGKRPLGAVLDIGTGTGRIAELLAPYADRVTALDKSPEMLRLARVRLQDVPADRVALIQGDFGALPFDAESFDTVVFHQVLHFAQEPHYALSEAARVCREGGSIAIADLAAHSREELRREHAHARLGFADEQMAEMLAEHGFAPAKTLACEGGELTVKIWTGVRRDPGIASIGQAATVAVERKAASR
ncbi:ArsR/SmtB family transcription factor [Tsuneonella mangrovi]|uniref:ArsR/SmtB family transcription factor n=1 Tax=Tsuneonella mangrovi TaxID=1982042 RepID=UPI000BA288D6|nr:metalloregulator ArsR/SmtB family transcription factor [Tsuneonella mangrovi]